MKKILGIALLALLATPGFAQDICDVALRSNAFNVSDKSESLRIAFEAKEAICERTYESSEEFRNAAKSGGFNLSYAGVGIGASGGKASAGGKKSFRSEAFCQAGQEDFALEYEKNQFVSTADAALTAWSKCIEATKTTSLWLEFKPNRDGTGMTGVIRRTIASGPTNLKITAMQVNPNTAKSDVSCTIETQTVSSDFFENGLIETDTTAEGVECTKPADITVRVSFGTDGGSLQWIEMPSVEEGERTNLEQLSARLSALQLALERSDAGLLQTDQSIKEQVSALEASLAAEQAARIQEIQAVSSRLGQYIPYGASIALRSIEGYLYSNNGQNQDEKDLLIYPSRTANTAWSLEK